MSSVNEDKERNPIPRLRSVQIAYRNGELDSERARAPGSLSTAQLDVLAAEFDRNPTISVAGDLLSVAITLGVEQRASEAAKFILADERATPQILKQVAGEAVGPFEHAYPWDGEDPLLDAIKMPALVNLYKQVSELKRALVFHPRDPIRWIEFARVYLVLGQQQKSLSAARVAVSLAGDSRFVLRSAARILLHLDRGDEAFAILNRSSVVKEDPWVLAAHVAIANSIEKTSSHLKTGVSAIDRQKFSPRHSSELCSAIGTVEAINGRMRQGKRLIRMSLIEGTENAVAQAHWLSRNVSKMGVVQISENAPKTVSAEANAWLALNKGDMADAVSQARRWQADQPFSSRPAVMGSFLASRTGSNNEEAVEFSRMGLLSNPTNVTLLNNLAFAYAQLNQLDNATAALKQIDPTLATEAEKTAIMATQGLVLMRSGRIEDGRVWYKRAIEVAEKRGDHRSLVAKIYLAIEELRAGTTTAPEAFASASKAADLLTEPEDVLLKRLLVENKHRYDVAGTANPLTPPSS